MISMDCHPTGSKHGACQVLGSAMSIDEFQANRTGGYQEWPTKIQVDVRF